MTSVLLSKLNQFNRAAAQGPVRMSVHEAPTERESRGQAPSARMADKALLYLAAAAAGASLLAAGHIVGASTQDTHGRELQSTSLTAQLAAQEAGARHQEVLQALLQRQSPEDRLRSQLRHVEVLTSGGRSLVLDVPSRLLLTQAASDAHRLPDVGLSWKDLYGVIHAETGWRARDGVGLNGKISRGLAQMEDDTARSLGVEDPNDPVQAAFGAAKLLKEAATWAAAKIRPLGLKGRAKAEALREGVSVYYNLSSKGRAAWNGANIHELPYATQRHVANVRDGALIAAAAHRAAQRAAPAEAESDIPKPQIALHAPDHAAPIDSLAEHLLRVAHAQMRKEQSAQGLRAAPPRLADPTQVTGIEAAGAPPTGLSNSSCLHLGARALIRRFRREQPTDRQDRQDRGLDAAGSRASEAVAPERMRT